MGKLIRRLMIGVLVLSAACTTSQQVEPPLAGPSEFALSLRVTATPDSVSQDGASQSSIVVSALDPNGRAISGLALRMDMGVNGVLQDYGTLSARTIVTGTDGRATTVYTAPVPPPPAAGGSSTVVTIVATPTSNNFATVNPQIVAIRLVPPGVILPPANTPTARFTFSSPVNVNVATLFDGSGSCPRGLDVSGGCLPPSSAGASIASYSWSFGDGGTASGVTATHKFTSPGVFNVVLTVTNDRGVSGSTSQAVTTALVDKPTVDFIYSPQPVLVKATISFNAGASAAAPGHSIVLYSWDFGDGSSATGANATHIFDVPQHYFVVLTVVDDTGQRNSSAPKDITVLSGNPVPAAVATAASAVTHTVNFDATATQTFGGATVKSYLWNFGDLANTTSTAGPRTSFNYAGAGAYTAQLTITDSLDRSASISVPVTAP